MKTCPVCNATVFDDMDICYGCMHRFDDSEAAANMASPITAANESFTASPGREKELVAPNDVPSDTSKDSAEVLTADGNCLDGLPLGTVVGPMEKAAANLLVENLAGAPVEVSVKVFSDASSATRHMSWLLLPASSDRCPYRHQEACCRPQ